MKKPLHSLASLAFVALISLTLTSCGGGLGDCVTNYTDGDTLRQSDVEESWCVESCAERMAPGGTGENVIASCFWTGSVRSITGI